MSFPPRYRFGRRAFLPLIAAPALAQSSTVEQWGTFETTLSGPGSGNPFLDVRISARFRLGDVEQAVDGFYDGAGQYRVRFMPSRPGVWSYETSSNVAELNGKSGRFTCVAPVQGNHGPVRVRDTFHFAYADGSRYIPVGTTCYAWNHQGEDLERQTLATLRGAPFNKMRMCIFPKDYVYNKNEPPFYAFERGASGAPDVTRFDPRFFRHLEQRIADLLALGIEADLILFHPYDRWGYAEMPADADDRYLRYLIARVAAFRNVWWSMANEFNFMKKKTLPDWERFCRIVRESDPYGHLQSIHNGGSEADIVFDHNLPWFTHVSIQSKDLTSGAKLRQQYRKPVIFDECYYEGNIPRRWGNISGREMMRRFWLGTVNGCYVGHGETYLHPQDILWWSKGGVLHGESPRRIAFLRKILEEAPAEGLTPYPASYYPCAGIAGKYYLYFLDIHQPRQYTLELPNGGRWQIDVIDPWEMTIAPSTRLYEGKAELALPGRPDTVLRVRRAA